MLIGIAGVLKKLLTVKLDNKFVVLWDRILEPLEFLGLNGTCVPIFIEMLLVVPDIS